MARQISRAEAWERAHEVFTQINFNSFDYNTIKESLLDYVKLYFPEDFNDYIESSEFIAILETFAYVGELVAYRLDMNAHENFITTAQRKESILRLAKLLSYKASRNIPARGLVKITSVQTTERVIDSSGRNLAGLRIHWNDLNNSNWKEQFLLVLNRVLEQEFGTVQPTERKQFNDVLFELYTLNNNPISPNGRSVLPYIVNADNTTYPMELVPVNLTDDGPVERRPEINAKFSILYASDGLGDSSDTTGFIMFTKQGTLQRRRQSFDGITPNQYYEVDADNINETDLWVNRVNPDTGEILINDPYAEILPHMVSEELRYGEWIEVDLANAQNIIFNTNRNRHKYEVETLDDDHVRIIFGDGEFSDIPSGTYDIWYRVSANEDLFIERNAVVNKSTSLTYLDETNTTQTLTLTFSLVSSLQNASASEDMDHIRRVAPSIYYTQDRMVNGRDYNTFMLQDPSILRLRAINRTFAGDSKYLAWHDPSGHYENVKIFGDDLAVFWLENSPEDGGLLTVTSSITASGLLFNHLEPLLSTTDFLAVIGPYLQRYGNYPIDVRKSFSESEIDEIVTEIQSIIDAGVGDLTLYFIPEANKWSTTDSGTGIVLVTASYLETSGWTIRWRTRRLIAHSNDTQFWNTNTTEGIINYDTLNTRMDNLVILQANYDANQTQLLNSNKNYVVLGQELVDVQLPTGGLPDTNRLAIFPGDDSGNNIPDDILQEFLFEAIYEGTWPADPEVPQVGDIPTGVTGTSAFIDLSELGAGERINNDPEGVKGGDADLEVYINGVQHTFQQNELQAIGSDASLLVLSRVGFTPGSVPIEGDEIRIVIKRFVYLSREDNMSSWIPQLDTDTMRTLYLTEDVENYLDQRYMRVPGRYPLNFAWFHHVPRFNLVDPSASNIIDMYILTRGYYIGYQRWLSGRTDIQPREPTSFELRSSYINLLDNRMLSDTVVLHPAKFKVLFGPKAPPQLQCKFKVIRPRHSSLTDNEIKVRIVDITRRFFSINEWEFGESFFFTELAAAVHAALGPEIDSIVLVPVYARHQFGDMFQIQAREDELFVPDISVSDIEVIQTLTSENIRQTI
jgi:hypothetical protein